MRACALPGCPVRFPAPHGGPQPQGFCSPQCHQASKIRTAPKPRARLIARPGVKRQRAISPASPAQRAGRAEAVSVISGSRTALEPAHLCARGRGGCDDSLCTVWLTHDEHSALDRGELDRLGIDLLGALVANGCVAELQHALGHYGGNMPALLQRLTGVRWAPASSDAAQRKGSS
jgi:hypothetical protein